jgi:hypothetical protein
VTNITLQRQGLVPFALQVGSHVLAGRSVKVKDGHRGPLMCQSLRDRSADPSPSPGYDRDLTAQTRARIIHRVPPLTMLPDL